MLSLNLHEIGATYYTGNCHKWLCAPKGAAFLYVKPEQQYKIHPATISHGANSPRTDRSRFQLEFDWTGNSDPTAYLCVPEAIQFLGTLLPGGWQELRQHNHQLILAARQILAEKLGVSLPCPDQMIGSMAVIPLPETWNIQPTLQEQLWQQFKIEVPVIPWQNGTQHLIRISAQIYNTLPQYEYLAQALLKLR